MCISVTAVRGYDGWGCWAQGFKSVLHYDPTLWEQNVLTSYSPLYQASVFWNFCSRYGEINGQLIKKNSSWIWFLFSLHKSYSFNFCFTSYFSILPQGGPPHNLIVVLKCLVLSDQQSKTKRYLNYYNVKLKWNIWEFLSK